MPKELVRHSGKDDFADLMVQWGRDELGDPNGEPRVRVFIAGARPCEIIVMQPQPGSGFYEDDSFGTIGPVDCRLDREQINRLIRVLRRARDQAYGKDE